MAIDLRDSLHDVPVKVAALPIVPSISAVTKVELEGGIYVRPALMVSRRLAVDAVLDHLTVIDFNGDMAAIYGQIVAQAGFSRRKIIDRMIAATAISQDLTLITLNGQDFTDITGLQLMVWNS